MSSDYRMSHNACCVLLNRGPKVFVRLFIYTGDHYPKWFFHVVSSNGNHSFCSSSFLSLTLALNGVLEFMNVTGACFERAPRSTAIKFLTDLFSDVIFSQEVAK